MAFWETSVAVSLRRDRRRARAKAPLDCLVFARGLPIVFHLLCPFSCHRRLVTWVLLLPFYRKRTWLREGRLPANRARVPPGLPSTKVCRDANFSECPPLDRTAYEAKTDFVKDLIPLFLEIRMENLRRPRNSHRLHKGVWWGPELGRAPEAGVGSGGFYGLEECGQSPCSWFRLSTLAEPLRWGAALVLPVLRRVPCKGIRPTHLG